MPNQSQVTIQFEVDTITRINRIAQLQNRSDNEIIKDAVNSYLDYINWFESEVQKGLDDANAGRLISHDELKDSLRGFGVEFD